MVISLADLICLVKELHNAVSSCYDSSHIANENRSKLDRLLLEYNHGIKDLGYLNIQELDPIDSRSLLRFRGNLHNNLEKLKDLALPVQDANIHNRVRRMRQDLQTCEDEITRFREFLKEVKVLPPPPDTPIDRFAPTIVVPSNPPRLTLDYDSPHTREGELKAAVLNKSSGRIVSVIAAGQGGVGKTCALRGLAGDDDIKRRFATILYIQLTKEASVATIVSGIARILEKSGGEHLARKVRALISLQEAAEDAERWFKGRSCLFMVDDVWCSNDINPKTFAALFNMVSETSRMVYTSRDQRLLRHADKVIRFEVKESQGATARSMLLKHAGLSEERLDEQGTDALKGILATCAGLPLAIGIAGASVWKKTQMCDPNEWRDVLAHVFEDMSSNRSHYMIDPTLSDYGSLVSVVDSSLNVLDGACGNASFQSFFTAFCTLPKQTEIPEQALQKLWSMGASKTREIMDKFNDVSLIQIRRRESARFMQIHDLILDIATHKAMESGEYQNYFRNLLQNYAQKHQSWRRVAEVAKNTTPAMLPRRRASAMKTLCKWAKCCSSSDGDRAATSPDHPATTGDCSLRQEWWKRKDDGYLHSNLCRALRNAGRNDDLVWLLSQPGWIVIRLVEGGFTHVEQDIQQGKAAMRGVSLENTEYSVFLDLIAKATRLSSTIVADNPYEVWFQLYGRLIGHAQRCNRTKRFVNEIERCAPRPFAKPSVGLLQLAGSAATNLITTRGIVRAVHEIENKVFSVWTVEQTDEQKVFGTMEYDTTHCTRETHQLCSKEVPSLSECVCGAISSNGEIIATGHWTGEILVWNRSGQLVATTQGHEARVCDIVFTADAEYIVSGSSDRTVRVWNAKSGEAIGQPLVGHTDAVWSVAVSGFVNKIISGSGDGTVRIWDAHSGEALLQPLIGHTDAVWSVAVSGNGKKIISGSEDETVRIWDAHSGEVLGNPLVGHTGGVSCVAVSETGNKIVSGSIDGTVRIWDSKSSEELGQPLVGHTDALQCVAVSGIGNKIVSGSLDGTVRMWNAMNEEALGQPRVESKDAVLCVAVSGSGNKIISESKDGDLRMWDAETRKALRQLLVDHTNAVWCEAVIRNMKTIVSGSTDGTVRITHARSGEALGRPLVGHTRAVSCVAVSEIGNKIISGSRDRTVRLWDSESGEALGRPLIGHTDAVWCVAASGDGNKIISGSRDRSVRMWDANSGEALGRPLIGHTGSVLCVAASRDGNRIASGSYDCTMRVWEGHSQLVVASVTFYAPVLLIGMNAKGSVVVTFDSAGGEHLWKVSTNECTATSCEAGESDVESPALCYSASNAYLYFCGNKMVAHDSGGKEIVVGTCDEQVVRIGNKFLSSTSKVCEILR